MNAPGLLLAVGLLLPVHAEAQVPGREIGMPVAIDVVAFGPGIDLLRDGNTNAQRIRSLVAQGVRFDACMNTVETIERETGKPYPLTADARKVEAGVVQIMTLAEHGYTTVRP